MKVYIASDHRGFDLKIKLSYLLSALGHSIEDLGPKELDVKDDYPDYALQVAQKVVQNQDTFGILICGSGVGMDIVANKVKGIRCGLGSSPDQIKLARQHDNINCLALASDFITEVDAKEMAITFLETPFSAEDRHVRRLEKISQYESSTH